MSRKSELKRKKALLTDTNMYRREVISGCISVDLIKNYAKEVELIIAGRLILKDTTGKISRLGTFSVLDDQRVINLEMVSANGFSISVYLVYSQKNIGYVDANVHFGDLIQLSGICKENESEEFFLAHSISVLSKAIGNIYNTSLRSAKAHGKKKILELARNPSLLLKFKKYTSVNRIVRMFLFNLGYEEIPLPIMQDYFEAGLADPFVTFSNESKKNLYLRLTGELYLRRLMVAGFTRVFELGRSFRNQGLSKSTKPEFSILELYSAYAKKEDMESMLYNMLLSILDNIYGSSLIPVDDGYYIDCEKKWRYVSFSEEYERITRKKYNQEISESEMADALIGEGIKIPCIANEYTLNNALYNHLLTKWKEPTWLTDLPKSKSPLNKVNDDNMTIDETFLVINRMLIADLVNAERDPNILLNTFKKQLTYQDEKDRGINWDFLSLMDYGIPPCRGIGMGIERLLMLIFNKKNILDVGIFF